MQAIKMRGARRKTQSHPVSNVLQQKVKMPGQLTVDSDGRQPELVEALIKQQKYPPLMQAELWTKSVPFRVCKKKKMNSCFVAELQEYSLYKVRMVSSYLTGSVDAVTIRNCFFFLPPPVSVWYLLSFNVLLVKA
jgi:hypothetical protein